MIQVLQPRERERRPSFGEKLSTGIGRGLETATQLYDQHQSNKKLEARNSAISKLMGEEGEEISKLDPDLQKLYIDYKLKRENKAAELKGEHETSQKTLRQLEKDRGLEPNSLSEYGKNVSLAEKVSKPGGEGATSSKPVPKNISSQISKILKENPRASADDLRIMMDEEGIPPAYSNPYTENRRRTEEQGSKTSEEKLRALRQETLPIRKEIAEKSMAASEGIRNKEQLLDLIEKGDIDDPTFATLAQALPLNLGKRLLSQDTVEYKAGLIQEFGDLKNLFQGATRVKEIELMEEKIADLYLTDDQKKGILRSRINALKADIIKAEVAEELEDKPLGVLQFNQELQKKTQKRLDVLFDQILDEQKAIIQNAENKKKSTLNPNDPEDRNVMQQILKEAKGDKQEARRIAKKKGYSY